tara:strand:- start:4233 stop:5096 length:864 start_codon:yes stop_codon:yes gene_type:complete
MKSGAKSVYVNYSGSKINIQTPVMNIPYGVNDNQKFIKDDPKRKDEPPKYDITVSFKGIDENPKIKVFHDKMKELEEKIIDDAFANRLAWFKNNYGGNKDTVSNMFSNIIKHDKDKETGEVVNKYPPTFKAKIPYNPLESKFEFDSYDMDNKEVDFTEYVSNLKGGRAQFIIQLNGIWFSAGMFGCSWKIVSGKFQQSNASKPTFIPDSDDDVEEDEEDEEDIEVDTDAIKAKTEETKEEEEEEEAEEEAVAEAEAEEEEEEEEDEEEEPEPPKPVKKAPVKKAAKK